MDNIIKVNVDTAEAKAKLRDIHRRREQTRSRLIEHARGGVARIAGAVGGYATASRMMRRMNPGGGPNPWGAALVPYIAAVQQYADKQLGYSAKAKKRARHIVASRLGASAHFLQSTAFAQEAYENALRFTQEEEEGRNIARQSLEGPNLEDVLAQAAKGYCKLIGQAFDYFYRKLTE